MINLRFKPNPNREIIYAIGKDGIRAIKCSVNIYDENDTMLIEEGIAIIDGNVSVIQIIKNKHLKISTDKKYKCKLFNFDKISVDDRFVDNGLEIDLLECTLLSNFSIVFPDKNGTIQCKMHIIPNIDNDKIIFRLTK